MEAAVGPTIVTEKLLTVDSESAWLFVPVVSDCADPRLNAWV